MRSLSSELLNKLKQSLQTKGNNANPRMQTMVVRAKTTVTDADYWTVETIRSNEGLGEIAVAARRNSERSIFNIKS